MSIDLAQAKRRMMIMIAIDGVAFVVAMAAAIGAFGYHLAWLTPVFIGALLIGFGAQFWFIAGFRRANKGV
jgi:hypothetical protein